MASLKHTKTAKINHQDHDVRFSRNKLSEALFLLSPHNFITEPPHPLLQHCLTDLSQAEQNWRQWVPINLAPTAKIWHYSPPTSPPIPAKCYPRLNPIWNSAELGHLLQKKWSGKRNREQLVKITCPGSEVWDWKCFTSFLSAILQQQLHCKWECRSQAPCG